MNPSLLSLSLCHLLLSCHFLPHSSAASTRSSSFGHAHTYTHTCSTDCLSSIFCSTLHHAMNRWITFPAPELCKNISPLREWEGIKNVTTQALEATDQFSRSNTVWLVGIHPWLQWLNFAVTVSASLLLAVHLKLDMINAGTQCVKKIAIHLFLVQHNRAKKRSDNTII